MLAVFLGVATVSTALCRVRQPQSRPAAALHVSECLDATAAVCAVVRNVGDAMTAATDSDCDTATRIRLAEKVHSAVETLKHLKRLYDADVDAADKAFSRGGGCAQAGEYKEQQLEEQDVDDDAVVRVCEAVADVFEREVKKTLPASAPAAAVDRWEPDGRRAFVRQAAVWVARHRPVHFCLPAFPFKFSNTDKTISTMPDMAEVLALRRLDAFLVAVQAVYPPGGRIALFSDGRIYNDIVAIPDAQVLAFRAALQRLAPSPRIAVFGMPDLMRDDDAAGLRRHFEVQFGEVDDAAADARVEADPDFRETLRGFTTFVEKELSVVAFDSPDARQRAVDAGARRMIRRNVAYRRFISTFFPAHLRLSIHPGANTVKFAVDLVGRSADVDPSSWLTPWHAAAVRRREGGKEEAGEADQWYLLPAAVAAAKGMELRRTPWPHFQEV